MKKNSIFICIKGSKTNGHLYIDEAIKKGAKTIFLEKDIIDKVKGINYIIVDSTKYILANLADKFYK